MRLAAAHGCVVAADRRAMTTAAHSRRREPQRGLVAGEPVITHRRKDGAQGWCGPGVCVLSEEPKPGRNETVWVHMRNCLHECNRTQVRPATNEEAEGIETVASLLPGLTCLEHNDAQRCKFCECAAGIFSRKPSDWSTYGGEEAGGGSNASEDGPPCVMGCATGRFTKSERRFSEAALQGKCWWLGELPDSGLSGLSGVQAQIITRLRAQARERGRVAYSEAKRWWLSSEMMRLFDRFPKCEGRTKWMCQHTSS